MLKISKLIIISLFLIYPSCSSKNIIVSDNEQNNYFFELGQFGLKNNIISQNIKISYYKDKLARDISNYYLVDFLLDLKDQIDPLLYYSTMEDDKIDNNEYINELILKEFWRILHTEKNRAIRAISEALIGAALGALAGCLTGRGAAIGAAVGGFVGSPKLTYYKKPDFYEDYSFNYYNKILKKNKSDILFLLISQAPPEKEPRKSSDKSLKKIEKKFESNHNKDEEPLLSDNDKTKDKEKEKNKLIME